MPLIVIDGPDCVGKTTLATRLAERFSFNLPKFYTGQRPEFKNADEHRFWSRAQYTMVARLLHAGVDLNVIFDRWIFTEYCYSPVLRGYSIDDHYWDIEKQIKDCGNIVWIYPTVGEGPEAERVLRKRYDDKNEDFLSFDQLLKVKKNFDKLFVESGIPRFKVPIDSIENQVSAIYEFIHSNRRK